MDKLYKVVGKYFGTFPVQPEEELPSCNGGLILGERLCLQDAETARDHFNTYYSGGTYQVVEVQA